MKQPPSAWRFWVMRVTESPGMLRQFLRTDKLHILKGIFYFILFFYFGLFSHLSESFILWLEAAAAVSSRVIHGFAAQPRCGGGGARVCVLEGGGDWIKRLVSSSSCRAGTAIDLAYWSGGSAADCWMALECRSKTARQGLHVMRLHSKRLQKIKVWISSHFGSFLNSSEDRHRVSSNVHLLHLHFPITETFEWQSGLLLLTWIYSDCKLSMTLGIVS